MRDWPKLAMLPPRAAHGPWYAPEVRRIAIRILVARVGLVSGALAGAIVAVMACVVVSFPPDDAEGSPRVELTRAALWELFQRAGLAEALIATPLTIGVLVYALRAATDEGARGRAFFASLGAAAAHVVLWPIVLALVALAFDGLDAGEVAGARESGGLNVTLFLCPVALLAGPLGAGFGMAFAVLTAFLRAQLHPATGRTLLAARCVSLFVLAVGLAALELIAFENRFEPYWLAVPTLVLGVIFVVDLCLTVALAIRGGLWLSQVRAGRVPEWRLVPVSLAYVGDDLAPISPSEGPMLALVRAGAATYRDLPPAVALVPALTSPSSPNEVA